MSSKKQFGRLNQRLDSVFLHLTDFRLALEHLTRQTDTITAQAAPPTPVGVLIADPAKRADPAEEKRGLDLLFDKASTMRHKCPICKHVRINKNCSEMCNKCASMMTSTPVQPTGKRSKQQKPRAHNVKAPSMKAATQHDKQIWVTA